MERRHFMDGYLFDPHTHTAETSKCGHLPAAEVVDRYVRHASPAWW